MNIYTIPNDLALDVSNELLILDYHATNDKLKNRVVLKKNVFSFLQEGTKGVITGEKTTTINNDQFLIMGGGNCLMTENISENNNYRSILFFFDNSILSNFCNNAKISRSKVKMHQAYTTFEYDEYIQQFVNSLIYIMQNNLGQIESLLNAKFEEIMYYLINKKGSDFITNLFSSEITIKENFRQVVEANKFNNLTLEELAFLCNMSISSFKRYFANCYQTSPIKWFLQKRLEYAAYLLKEGKQRPSDIYQEVGFQNLSSFSQAFKQAYNVTPKQFQERE